MTQSSNNGCSQHHDQTCVSTAFHPLFSLYDRQFLLPTNPILHLQVLYPSTSPVLVMTTLTYHMREPTLKTQIIQSTSTILTKQLVGRVTYQYITKS